MVLAVHAGPRLRLRLPCNAAELMKKDRRFPTPLTPPEWEGRTQNIEPETLTAATPAPHPALSHRARETPSAPALELVSVLPDGSRSALCPHPADNNQRHTHCPEQPQTKPSPSGRGARVEGWTCSEKMRLAMDMLYLHLPLIRPRGVRRWRQNWWVYLTRNAASVGQQCPLTKWPASPARRGCT